MSRMEPITVTVRTASRTYDVVVGPGLLDGLGVRVRAACGAGAAFVVSDSNVAPLYLERAVASLKAAELRVATRMFAAGEQSKRMGTLERILEAMASAGLTRDDLVVALGGGVVGDMAGFAAACYMRGIEVVQVPTTLLSMVDSSVGGKTAIDLSGGKNLAGAFLQPSLVLSDVDCLRTLDEEDFADGMGEVIKHGVLADARLFGELAEDPLGVGADAGRLARVVARNVQIKRDVVGQDERERGLRQTLNLGHTIGHAIEAASGFSLGHGHCVAAGLCCVARASEQLGWSEPGLAARIEACVEAQGLPCDTDIAHDAITWFALRDKKRHGGSVSLVVPVSLGSCRVVEVSLGQLGQVVALGCGVGT